MARLLHLLFLVLAALFALMATMPGCFAATDPDDPLTHGVGDYNSFQNYYLEKDSFSKGIYVGEFIVHPQLSLADTYDNNIYRTQNNAEGSSIVVAGPSVAVNSDWGTNALNFSAADQSGRYLQYSSEDYNDWNAGADGRLDIIRGLYLTGSIRDAFLHDNRGLPSNGIGITPDTYNQMTSQIALTRDITRITASLSGEIVRTTYDNNETLASTPIINSMHDQNQYKAELQTGYEVAKDLQLFVRTSANEIRFDNAAEASADNSSGYTLDVGASFGPEGNLRGQWYVGYLDQTSDNSNLHAASGIDYGGKLLWISSDLTQIEVMGSRTIQPTLLDGASGILESTLQLTVTHQLLRNVMLLAGPSYTNDKYNGLNLNYEMLGFNFGARYFLSEHVAFNADYNFTKQTTNATVGNFNDNRFTVGLLLGL